MIYDIAVGAFIALAAFDLVSYAAGKIAYQVTMKQRAKKLQELMDSWDDIQFSKPKPRKKAAVKKKVVTKRK